MAESPAQPDARVALVHPGGYPEAMASLGYLGILGEMLRAGVPVHRILTDRAGRMESIEEGRAPGTYGMLGFSVAYELQVPRVIAALEGARIRSDPARRRRTDPLIIAGGALTLVNPRPLLWFADLVVVGDGVPAVRALARALRAGAGRDEARDAIAAEPNVLDARAGLTDASVETVRAAAATRYTTGIGPLASPVVMAGGTAFGDSFLVEACRGCPRACSFCVLRRDRCGPFVSYAADAVVDAVPIGAERVGLVGAGISDHPDLSRMLERLADAGKTVSTSSLRIGALDDRRLAALAKAGCRRLTVGVDGLSERLRRSLGKSLPDARIVDLAERARARGIGALKLYVMVGLPGEEDGDVAAFAQVARKVARIVRLAVSAGPLVPKPDTPLAARPLAPAAIVGARLAALRKVLGPVARLDLASPRAAVREYEIGHARLGDRAIILRRPG